jgi:hypothetical protein
MITYKFHLNGGVGEYKNYSKYLCPLNIKSTFLEQKWSTVLIEVEDAQVQFTADDYGVKVEFVTDSMSAGRAEEIMEAIRKNMSAEAELRYPGMRERVVKLYKERREEVERQNIQANKKEEAIKEAEAEKRWREDERLRLRKEAEAFQQRAISPTGKGKVSASSS